LFGGTEENKIENLIQKGDNFQKGSLLTKVHCLMPHLQDRKWTLPHKGQFVVTITAVMYTKHNKGDTIWSEFYSTDDINQDWKSANY